MKKLTELDIRLGMEVQTPEGKGIIENADRRKDAYGIAIKSELRNLKSFKLSELSIANSITPSITQEIGDLAIIFSRIEDRLQDFLNYVFDFRNTKQRIMLIKDFSITRTLDIINDIIKDCYSKMSPTLIKWNSIYSKLKKLIPIRNNIIHGSMVSFNDEYIFSNSKKISNININPETQVFNFEKLIKTVGSLYDLYYQNMFFLNEICQEVKTHLNKSDKEIFNSRIL